VEQGSSRGDTVNADEARQVLEDERRERLEACQAALNALLAEYGCSIQVQHTIVVVENKDA